MLIVFETINSRHFDYHELSARGGGFLREWRWCGALLGTIGALLMNRLSIAEELESAADLIAHMSHADLQIILRRAASMLRNVAVVPLEQATEDAFDCIASQMKIPRSDIIETVLRGWLEARLDLPIPTDEDNDTNQRA